MEEGNNKKKLIGTVIGVIFFVILIAGATFAWLTYTANVNNGVYNTTTMNFLVNYQGGTDISSLPMYSGDVSASTFSAGSISPITVQASKQNLDGTLYLKLHTNSGTEANATDSNLLADAGCIKYAVCVGTACSGASTTPFSQITGVTTGVLDSTNFDTNNDIVIYEGPLTSTTTNYNIYLWIDNELITNDEIGLTYQGYVHAFAVQSELGNSAPSSNR